MKFEKKHWIMLIVGVVVLYLVWYFLIKKKKTESSYDSLPLIGSENSFNPDIMIPGTDEWYGESGFGRVANVKVGVGGGTVSVLTCPKGYTLNTYTYNGVSYSLCERGSKSVNPIDVKTSEANFAGARSASIGMPFVFALNKPCTKNGVIIDCATLPRPIKNIIIAGA
jgi:hypothetical protein